jgi:hypothetical protein
MESRLLSDTTLGVVSQSHRDVRAGERFSNGVRTPQRSLIMRGKQIVVIVMLALAAGTTAVMAQTKVAAPQTTSTRQWQMEDKFDQSQNKPPVLQGQNAANAYIAAWDSVSGEMRSVLSDTADERQGSALVENQAYIERIIAAAMMEKCDWGLDYNGGLELLLPHLGQMRAAARTLIADATRLMKLEGTPEQRAQHEREAVRRVIAVLRMSAHVSRDRIVISALVSSAINSVGRDWATSRVREGTLSTDSAQQVLGTLRALEREDMFGARESVRGEWDILDAWLKNRYGGDDGAKKLAELLPSLGGDGVHPADDTIAKMNRAEFDAAIARTRDFYMDNVEAWDKPDAKDRLSKLATSVSNGEYGPVALRLAAVLERAWAADDKSRREFAAAKSLLDTYVQHNGKLPPEVQQGTAGGE